MTKVQTVKTEGKEVKETKKVVIDTKVVSAFKDGLDNLSLNIDGIESEAIKLLVTIENADVNTLKHIRAEIMPSYMKKYGLQTTLFKNIRDIISMLIKGAKLPDNASDRTVGNVLSKVKEDYKKLEQKKAQELAAQAAQAAKDVAKSEAVSDTVKKQLEAEALEAEAKAIEAELSSVEDEKKAALLKKEIEHKKANSISLKKEVALSKMEEAKALGKEKEVERAKKEIDQLNKKEQQLKDAQKEHQARVDDALNAIKALKKLSNEKIAEVLVNSSDTELEAIIKLIGTLTESVAA